MHAFVHLFVLGVRMLGRGHPTGAILADAIAAPMQSPGCLLMSFAGPRWRLLITLDLESNLLTNFKL